MNIKEKVRKVIILDKEQNQGKSLEHDREISLRCHPKVPSIFNEKFINNKKMYCLGIENESKSFNLFGNLYNSSCLPPQQRSYKPSRSLTD